MSHRPFPYLLWIVILLYACDEAKDRELQNVEITQAPVERSFAYSDYSSLKGNSQKLDLKKADYKVVRQLEGTKLKKNIVKAGKPKKYGVPAQLPSVHFSSNTLKEQKPYRTEPQIVNSGFPDWNTTLPPRYRDASKFDIQYMDVNQGLNSSYVWDIEQDADGYMWFATFGGGLGRYDGRSLVRYTENQGLPSSYIWCLEEDHDGNLWIGTYGHGLAKFDGKAFSKYNTENGLPSNEILSLLVDIEGNLWISTDTAGVIKFDGSRFTPVNTSNGLSSNEVWDIYQDDRRNIWFATNGGGITIYDGKDFSYLSTQEGLSSDTVWTVTQDEDGFIWIGTNGGGLNKYDGDSITVYTKEQGLSSNRIRDISEDDDGVLWLATEGGGLCSFDGKRFGKYSLAEGVTSDFIRSIYCDEEGNVWFGTDGGGVNRFAPHSFRHYTKDDGMISNFVWSIFEDSKGNIWYGTDGDGACMFDGETYTYFTEEDGLGNNIVLSIIEDHNGHIWFATDMGGISWYDGKKIMTINQQDGLPSNRFWDILEDSEHNLWFASNDQGICKYDGTTLTTYNKESGLLSNTIIKLFEDRNGDIWIINQERGVSKIRGDKISHYTAKNGLSSNLVQSIHQDYQGNIWLGHTGKGLDKFDGKTITNFTTADGLNSNYIWSINEDSSKRLWICTETGISCMNIDTLTDSPFPKIYSYTKQDGLKSLDFYPNSTLFDSNNRLWWGSSHAVTMLDLNHFDLVNTSPIIHLTNVVINEENIDFSKLSISDSLGYTYSSVEQFENVPVDLDLSYDNNHLTFHFSGIDWNASQKVKFSYLLEGIDLHWSAPSTENKADYRNLPPGEHTFKVKALSASGMWSDPVEITFNISPPWWESWWAIIAYLFGLYLIAHAGYKVRTIKFRKHQRVLEQTVRKRTNELYIQKKELERQKFVVDTAYSQLEEKNDEIMDSITYAKRIQAAILPSDQYVQQNLPESFVLYLPKDIVAGDFYWCEKVGSKILIAAADCTGHGVPGAMISVICHSALNRALREYNLSRPDEILNKTREIIITKFEKSEEGIRDGMDISLAVIDMNSGIIQWAGANNPLWIIRKDQDIVQEIKGDKQPIGKYPSSKPFTSHEIKIEKGDTIYLLTDGFPDQFGGEKGKKYKSINLKDFLLKISKDDMNIQPYKLKTEFYHWKNELEQIDDVCIIGVRF